MYFFSFIWLISSLWILVIDSYGLIQSSLIVALLFVYMLLISLIICIFSTLLNFQMYDLCCLLCCKIEELSDNLCIKICFHLCRYCFHLLFLISRTCVSCSSLNWLIFHAVDDHIMKYVNNFELCVNEDNCVLISAV